MINLKKRPAASLSEHDEIVQKKVSKLKSSTKSAAHHPKSAFPTGGKKRNAFAGATAKHFDGGKKPKGKTEVSTEPKDWRKFKNEKKELKLKRKQDKRTKDTYAISTEAKSIYEKLKCRRTENKSLLVDKLFVLLGSDETIKKLVMAHDTARVIQCMLKYATPVVREDLSEKLLPLAAGMAISKYAHFCVLRMFKYGSANIKLKLVNSFYGSIVKLASHNISSKILDHAYITVASEDQKAKMRQELYGDLYKSSKDDSVKQLADTYRNVSSMKASILSAVKANLEHIANKALVDNSLVHAVMLEYLHECEEDKVEESVAAFSHLIPLMLSTKEGTQAAIICFYKATSKHRRAIIKVIKEHLVKICTHEHGHNFIIALINTLDDTKATKKAIYDSLHPELHTLVANQWGRRVFQWLVSPGDTNCFHPTFIAAIENGLSFSKKDKNVRRKEIFEQIEVSIVVNMVEQPDFWLSTGHVALVTAEILKKIGDENFCKVAASLAVVIANPNWEVVVEESLKEKIPKKPLSTEKIVVAELDKLRKQKRKRQTLAQPKTIQVAEEHPVEVAAESTKQTIAGIEEAGLHIALKKILKNDKERQQRNGTTFGAVLMQHLLPETLQLWITLNRGCFILLNTLENNDVAVTSDLKNAIGPIKEQLNKQTSNGAKLLFKRLFVSV